ncbi:hypothetical protein VHEMI08112 [[Torrubiella] hemipterigena]|uniref:Zn(2)-C6 fungal-type domain-containing protein n=1 Tax=[Torrubiella] hemipterigena TaxID=1531966 RepID=A0A0A1TML6_9HYPO|nr:hypothetical protein VHEMI08112 [[Torrubiella] hemipterigena]
MRYTFTSTSLSPERSRSGLACNECRSRKRKCDGVQPQCSNCVDFGSQCVVDTNRSARGPKKGYLKALENKIALLESQLQQQQQQPFIQDAQSSSSETPEKPQNKESSASRDMHNSELMQAELNQLYFDRVHLFVPILHQRSYLRWANTAETKTPSQGCLQHAMWTLAALLSGQFQYLQESLYQETKSRLDLWSTSRKNSNIDQSDVEMAQATVLMALYESMKAHHWQAWMTAGRAFRLVQLMKLHELDRPESKDAREPNSIVQEEKRRVFWMAYFLDHLISMRNDWPITLNEHVICTRLPVAEADFQTSQPTVGPFLSEAMTESRPCVLSPLNECIIFATICGRSLLQYQQHSIRSVYGDESTDQPDHQQWLNGILASRLQILGEHYPAPADTDDTMLLFAHIMAQTSILYLCQSGIYGRPGAMVQDRQDPATLDMLKPGLEAATRVASMAELLTEFHVFNIHPLMPMPLFVSVEFLYNNRERGESIKAQLERFLGILGKLKNINDLSKSYVHLLGLTCTAVSSQIVSA